MLRRPRIARLVTVPATFAALLALPALLLAHAVVFPGASAPGAYEKYVLRVPNEKNVATTRVELRFPSEVRVVSFADVPGWTLQVVTDSAKRVVAAVWTGTLPPQRFVELPFVAVNPRARVRLVWPAYQTYADGEQVAWTGPADGSTPASITVIESPSRGRAATTMVLASGALVIGLVSLGLVLRRPTRT